MKLLGQAKAAIFLLIVLNCTSAWSQTYDEFFKAIEFDHADTIHGLLVRGFDPNTPSPELQPGLTLALQKDALKVAEVLLRWPGVKINALNPHHESPLMMAALRGHLHLARKLVEREADVNKTGWTPLHYAATGGHVALIEFLLDQHAYIDAASPNETTPLMMAAHYGNPAATRLLVQRGADPGLKNQLGLSALDFAQNGTHPESVSLIKDALQRLR